MFKLGLTGSIGMGKSTTAGLFKDLNCAVWDADAAVHRIYSKNGTAVADIRERWPSAIVDEAVSRDKLKDLISADPSVLKALEGIVHPLVRADREAFSRQTSADIVVFDIPLLFETGSEGEFDAIACVRVSVSEQTRRVMARGTLSMEQLEMIRDKQMPADDKVLKSDYVIETDTLDHAKSQVIAILADIRKTQNNA